MSGTVNISRAIWDDAAFRAETFTEREAFIWMIMEASWKDREKRVGVTGVMLKRGQLATSIRFMADAWGWSKSSVERFLERLKKRDMIGTATGTACTVITISKYNEYQYQQQETGTQENEKPGQQRDSSGTNYKKGLIPELSKKDKPNGLPKKTRAETLLDPEWEPSAKNLADAADRDFTPAEIAQEADQFVNHHTAKGNRMRDWDAAWRTWLGNARKFARNNGPPQSSQQKTDLDAAFARAFQEMKPQ